MGSGRALVLPLEFVWSRGAVLVLTAVCSFPMQLYNDRRVYPGGGGPAVANGDLFVPAPTATAATGGAANDRRNGRGRYVDGRNGVFHVLCISDSIGVLRV